MDYTTYTPGSMSSTDFYDNLIGDALSGAFNRQDNSVTEDSTPAFTEHYYEGDATPKMDIPTSQSAPVYNYSDPSKWTPSTRLLNRIKSWEGSSMRTNVPFNEVRRQFTGISPNLKYLNDNQRDALYSYYYNLKPSTYRKQIVPLLSKLNGSDDTDTLNRIRSSINVGMNRTNLPGLRNRRLAEQRIFDGRYAIGGELGMNDAVTPLADSKSMNYNPSVGNVGMTSLGSMMTQGVNDKVNNVLGSNIKLPFSQPTQGGLSKLMGAGLKSGAISAGVDMLGSALAGGKTTKAGSAMNSLGNVASMIPGPYGAVASIALKGLGSLTNAAFGSKMNEQFINDTYQGINKQASWNSQAQSSDQLLSDAHNITQMNEVSKSQVGSDGWFSNKAARKTAELNQRINDANNRSYNNLINTSDNISKNTSLNMMANYSAFGGPLNFTRDNLVYPHNYSWLAEGGQLDNNLIYPELLLTKNKQLKRK